MPKLNVLGMTCGVGSMLIGARTAGFKVLGNIEWRKYYHTGTFERNFPKSFMVHSIDEIEPDEKKMASITGVDLIMGHPECGNFSALSYCMQNPALEKDPADIPLFIKTIARLKPRYFVMDDLPRSFHAFPIEQYKKLLPDYDLFPEWISNYDYGNFQKHRRRMFMIGALKSESFTFWPGEVPNNALILDAIGDMPEHDIPDWNHIRFKSNHIVAGWGDYTIGLDTGNGRITYAQFRRYLKKWLKSGGRYGESIPYTNRKGEVKTRIGRTVISFDRAAPTVSGGGYGGQDNHFRPDTFFPLTIREDARIQGCPDDFIFYPIVRPEDDWKEYMKIYNDQRKQVGKFMPIQFCEYIAKQIRAHINGRNFKCSRRRVIRPNDLVTKEKIRYCKKYGYTDQFSACAACWIEDCGVKKK